LWREVVLCPGSVPEGYFHLSARCFSSGLVGRTLACKPVLSTLHP
jgi:hypothetical protein